MNMTFKRYSFLLLLSSPNCWLGATLFTSAGCSGVVSGEPSAVDAPVTASTLASAGLEDGGLAHSPPPVEGPRAAAVATTMATVAASVVPTIAPVALEEEPEAASSAAQHETAPQADTPVAAEEGVLNDPASAPFGPAALRMLTPSQMGNTIAALFGEAALDVVDLGDSHHVNGSAAVAMVRLTMSSADTERHEANALALASWLVDDADRMAVRVPCDPADVGCLRGFVTSFGRDAWRRPMLAGEVEAYVELGLAAAARLQQPWESIRWAVVGLLQSPHFLYRVEIGESTSGEARRTLSDHELAGRLAYTLTDGPPDRELALAADEGSLRANLETHVERLLAGPRGERGAAQLFAEHFQLYRLNASVKSEDEFPTFTDSLRSSMAEQTIRTAVRLAFAEDGDFRSLLTTRRTFINEEMAAHYGVELAAGTGFREHVFPASSERAGILTHASLMTALAHPSTTSPTVRGRYVRETLLCQAIPAPPPSAEANLPEPVGGYTTQRDRLAVHVSAPECAVCHKLMDPLGLALENFDAVGTFRERDGDSELDTSGDLDGRAFDGPVELGEILADDERVPDCFVQSVVRNAMGALATSSEAALVAQLEWTFESSGFQTRALLKALTTSPAFATVRPYDQETDQ